MKFKKAILFILALNGLSQMVMANDEVIRYAFKERSAQKFCPNIINGYTNDHTYIFDSSNANTSIGKCLINLETENDPQKVAQCFSRQTEVRDNGAGYADKSIKVNLDFNIQVLHNSKGVKYTLIDKNSGKVIIPKTSLAPGQDIRFSAPSLTLPYNAMINMKYAYHTYDNKALNIDNTYSLLISGLYYHKHPVSLRYDIKPYVKDLKFHPAGSRCDSGPSFQCDSPIQANPYYLPHLAALGGYDTAAFGYVDYFGYFGHVGLKVTSPSIIMTPSLKDESDDIKNAGCGFTSNLEGDYINHNNREKTAGGPSPKGPGFYGYNNMVFNFELNAKVDADMSYTGTNALVINDLDYEMAGDSAKSTMHSQIIK